MKRRAPSFLPPIALARDSSEPLHRQLYHQLRRTASPAAALPSTRALAAHLGVSRNTVLNAYEALAEEGLVVAKPGSGTRWRRTRRPAPTPADLLRDSHFPFDATPLRDPDGNHLYLHR